MSRSKPNRRWLQFGLRGVLVLTLAVALWLGYEVRQARHVEQTVAALQELGGDAETELTGWSLLRMCRVPGYGRRIVRAEIPGSTAEKAIDVLRSAASLREVQVMYDGTYDPSPSWKVLVSALPRVRLNPQTEQEIDDEGQEGHQFWQRRINCFGRLAAKALERYPNVSVFNRTTAFTGTTRMLRYRIVRLPDDSLAEIVSGHGWWNPAPATVDCFAILVSDDQCVGMRGFSTNEEAIPEVMLNPEIVVEDFDGDGVEELGFRLPNQLASDPRIRHLPGDPSHWLGVYKIQCDGFTSLLPEDNSIFPNADAESVLSPAGVVALDP